MNTIEFYAAVTGLKKWEKAGKLRLYASTAKHLSVFLDFQDGDVQMGAALKVFTNGCEGQPRAWHESQIRLAKDGIGRAKFVKYLAAAAFAGQQPGNHAFSEAEVESVKELLDSQKSELAEIGKDDAAMKELEEAAKALSLHAVKHSGPAC